jgi:hypothetical protein
VCPVRREFLKRLHKRYAREGLTFAPAQAAPVHP